MTAPTCLLVWGQTIASLLCTWLSHVLWHDRCFKWLWLEDWHGRWRMWSRICVPFRRTWSHLHYWRWFESCLFGFVLVEFFIFVLEFLPPYSTPLTKPFVRCWVGVKVFCQNLYLTQRHIRLCLDWCRRRRHCSLDLATSWRAFQWPWPRRTWPSRLKLNDGMCRHNPSQTHSVIQIDGK